MANDSSALKVAAEEGTHAADEPFVFPTLTQDRAVEIADEIVIESQYNRRVMALVVELALGLAPVHPDDASANLDRADAAHHFASQMFRNTPGFDECVRIFIRRSAEQAQGGTNE